MTLYNEKTEVRVSVPRAAEGVVTGYMCSLGALVMATDPSESEVTILATLPTTRLQTLQEFIADEMKNNWVKSTRHEWS
jgi:hypothetical protein